ncbi:MAG: hypothetical protein QNJ98_10360 [Planctomycetota bacterium]|nr:hypothetical protein [Planctomycetota bacterium]
MAVRERIVFEAPGNVRLLAPRQPAEGPTGALVAVHGYGQPPQSLLAYATLVAPPEVPIVVPEGPSTFYRRPSSRGSRKGGIGHGWIADPDRADTDRRNDALIGAALDLALERFELDPARIWLLGYSQGVGVATHFAASHPDRIAGLVGLAGGVPMAYRPGLSALSGKPVLWVTGTRDPSYPPDYSAAVVEAFEAGGAAIRHEALDADHDLMADARSVVAAWLEAHLNRVK